MKLKSSSYYVLIGYGQIPSMLLCEQTTQVHGEGAKSCFLAQDMRSQPSLSCSFHHPQEGFVLSIVIN